MRREHVWTVIGLVERSGKAHVSLGRRGGGGVLPANGPTLLVELGEAPKLGDPVLCVYTWGREYHEPVVGAVLPPRPVTQVDSCGVCGGLIDYIDCPTGGWWKHWSHPPDGHDAVGKEVFSALEKN